MLSKLVNKMMILLIYVITYTVVLTVPTYFLWNWLMPSIFNGVKEITFFQAIGLNILAGILLKNIPEDKNV